VVRNLEAELEHETGEWPAAWKPQEGECVSGIVRRYSVGTGQFGSVRTCILEKANGERVSLWLNSTVLLSLFERERPKVGEQIGIKYLGKHPDKGYKRFALLVDRDEQEPDFSPVGGEQETDPFDFT